MIAFYIDADLFEHNITAFQFSAGERQVRLPVLAMPPRIERKLVVRAHIGNPESILDLLLTVDALRRHYSSLAHVEKILYLPYLPYSRQDRVCAKGEALSISVFARLINSLCFDKVVTLDCHSEVGVSLIDNCQNISQVELVRSCLDPKGKRIAFVSPDAGASKKIFELYSTSGNNAMLVKADKVRNPVSGEITGVSVNYTELPHEWQYLIVDDICDGGRTFIELAQVLKNKGATDIHLWVTHGIFSKGTKVFENVISNVYFTDSFKHGIPPQRWESQTKFASFPVVANLIRQEFEN